MPDKFEVDHLCIPHEPLDWLAQYSIRKGAFPFVTDSALQLTLRESKAFLIKTSTLTILTVVAVVLGLSGPFGSFGALTLGPRLAYWFATTFATFTAGVVFGTLAEHIFGHRLPGWLRIVLVGTASGIPVTIVVTVINYLAFPHIDELFLSVPPLLVYCVVISIGVTMSISMFSNKASSLKPAVEVGQTETEILARLPIEVRGPLVRMSMQDHYVEVETTRGKTLVLMRMADAIKETGGVSGMQTHRSHWVALDQIAEVQRTNGKVNLRTKSGVEIPVSRTYLPALRAAGLLN